MPASLFPQLLEGVGLERHLYLAYAELGVFIVQAEDRVSAVAADAASANELGVPLATPLLAVERTAYALDRRSVELRSSLFALAGAAYHGAIGNEPRT